MALTGLPRRRTNGAGCSNSNLERSLAGGNIRLYRDHSHVEEAFQSCDTKPPHSIARSQKLGEGPGVLNALAQLLESKIEDQAEDAKDDEEPRRHWAQEREQS